MDKNKRKEKEKNFVNRLTALMQLLMIAAVIIIIPLYIYLKHPEFIDNFRSLEAFDSFINAYEDQAVIVYILCQIMQIVITIIPGQVIQIAGGYMFGFIFTTLISLIGVIIGSSISFGIARVLGKRPIKLICGEERFSKYNRLLNTKKAHRVIFLLYFIPGFPKDIVAYIAGVSQIRYLSFILLSTIGRLPSMMASIVMGTMLVNKSYTGAVVLAAVVVVVFIFCIIKRQKILQFTDKYYDKLNTKDKNVYQK